MNVLESALPTGVAVKLLAISGSLRAGSSNTTLLEAAGLLAPDGVVVRLYGGLEELPHFNPDLDTPDGGELPGAVAELRGLVGEADALLLSTPEYAHGLPGAFKNVLDWLVGSTEFPGKPVAVISPTARSEHAPAQLREVLATMSARLVEDASVVVPLARREMTATEIAAAAEPSTLLRGSLAVLADAVRRGDKVDGAAEPRFGGGTASVAVRGTRLDYRKASPGVVEAMSALERHTRECRLERPLLELVKVRASQINGCGYCLDMHSREARAAGETEQRLYVLPAWREAPFYSRRERAALAWTEAVTLISTNDVPDTLYEQVEEQFSGPELVDLTLAIVAINGWNRLAIAFRTEVGSYRPASAAGA